MNLNVFATRLVGFRVRTSGLLALTLAVACLSGCGGGDGTEAAEIENSSGFDEALTIEELADDIVPEGAMAKNGARPVPPQPNPAYRWNELALEAARKGSMSDAQAARLYAMVNVAMYDAVNGIEACISPRRSSALVRSHGAPHGASLSAAASAAARTVLMAAYPDLSSKYAAQHEQDLALLRNGKARRDGIAWGTAVGNQVVALRQRDGSQFNEELAAGDGPGAFRAKWNAVQFRNLRPFGIKDPSRYIGSGPPALNSREYAEAFNDVRNAGNAARPDQRALETYQFWASNAGTSQPAGEWIKLASMLGQREKLSLPETTRMFALLGMALSDVVAPTYATKYRFKSWRPATAIREADTDGNVHTTADATWSPRGGSIGGSPEYLSGHSSFAAAGTSVLRGFFCQDEFRFTLQTDGSTSGARQYRSLSEIEAEAGRSRILGGVHFQFSNEAGLQLGRSVADELLSRSLLRQHGETHRHQRGNVKRCPK